MSRQAIRDAVLGCTYKGDDGRWHALSGYQIDAVMEAIEPVVQEFQRAIEEARQLVPAEGVWLVEHQPTGHRMYRISQLGELPEPVPFSALARHRDAIAQGVVVALNSGARTPNDVADAVLRALWDAPTPDVPNTRGDGELAPQSK